LAKVLFVLLIVTKSLSSIPSCPITDTEYVDISENIINNREGKTKKELPEYSCNLVTL
jgi:hypothetical protein